MSHRRIIPNIPASASELLTRIDEAKWSDPEDFEEQLPKLIGSRLSWIFNYSGRFYPECVKYTEVFNAPIIELVDLQRGEQTAYSPKTGYYRIGKYILDDSESPDVRFIISEVEQTAHGESVTDIFNRIFDGDSGEMLGSGDGMISGRIYELITRPDLYFKAHLDESWLAKRLRLFNRSRLGKTAVKYAKLPED